MAAPQFQVYNFASGNIGIVGVTETVAGTSQKVSSSYPGCTFAIRFSVDFTPGTGATSVVARIERGTAAGGTVIYGSQAITVVAAQPQRWSFEATDQQAGDVASQQYVLTLQQAGASGNGTVANVFSSITVAE